MGFNFDVAPEHKKNAGDKFKRPQIKKYFFSDRGTLAGHNSLTGPFL
jgi:hypothetical protein